MAAADHLLLHPATKKPRNCSEADPPSTISILGDDLLVELLIRLPNARSAFRCKSVWQQWSSLISTPNFRRVFVSRHRRNDDSSSEPPLLPSDNAQSILSFLPVPAEIRKRFKVFDSSNDLVLCGFEIYKDNETCPELGRLFIVCNPFTKQWTSLPLAPERSDSHYRPGTSLACEPSNDRFRVVRVSRGIVDLFCSESGEWMKDVVAMDHMSRVIGRDVWSCCNCNGKLYWQSTMSGDIAVWDPFRPDTPPTSIHAVYSRRLKLSTRRVCAVQGALQVVFAEQCYRLGRSRGCRVIVRTWREEEDGGGKWRILYQVDLDPMLSSFSEEFPGLKLSKVLATHPSM